MKWLISSLALMACLLQPVRARADVDLLVFPELRLAYEDGDRLTDPAVTPSLDLFFTAHKGRLKLLVETLAEEDDVSAERLQLGYEPAPGTSIWLGRIHNPLGYWITRYHHGTYLQPSISRPASAEFDHDGGPFPGHLVGLLFTTEQLFGPASLDYNLAVGAGPELRAEAGSGADERFLLHSIDLLKPNTGRHGVNVTARVSYRPDATADDAVSVFGSYVRVPVDNPAYDPVDLVITGLSVHTELDFTTLTGSLFVSGDHVQGDKGRGWRRFVTGYLHADLPLNSAVSAFVRFEHSWSYRDDPYVNLLQGFIPKRHVLGLCWDFNLGQALKLEYSRNQRQGHSFWQTLVNWSAVFP